MFIVVDKNTGKPTGTVYEKVNLTIQNHHEQYGEVLYEVDTMPVNNGTEELPDYEPINPRLVEGDRIVNYLDSYMNNIALQKGYKAGYESMFALVNSSNLRQQQEGQQMLDLFDAIVNYRDANVQTFLETGQPDFETVKLEHPKWEDFTPVV